MKVHFGTSGIRGRTDVDITSTLAIKVGFAFGKHVGKGSTVAVGHDTRKGAEILSHFLSVALRSCGVITESCGCVPSPALSHHIINRSLDGGVNITGSHLPPNMIGIIPLTAKGTYIPDSIARELEVIIEEGGSVITPDEDEGGPL